IGDAKRITKSNGFALIGCACGFIFIGQPQATTYQVIKKSNAFFRRCQKYNYENKTNYSTINFATFEASPVIICIT
ncbi:MAG: hypothetical protein Q4Q06_07725, partial [Bacteroidota bacterium]|nr:hypothetical protein [Bacteroidota bacterium]